METFKVVAVSLLLAFVLGIGANQIGQLGPTNDARTNDESRFGNVSGVDEKFEGGVKAYGEYRDDRQDYNTPDGPGGN
jgi:hypothetical protein